MLEPLLVSIEDAAALLGISRMTFERHLLGRGAIRTVKIGVRQLVPVSELHRYVAEALDEAPTATDPTGFTKEEVRPTQPLEPHEAALSPKEQTILARALGLTTARPRHHRPSPR